MGGDRGRLGAARRHGPRRLERDVLYLGALTAAVLLLGGVRWLVEPVLAAGTVIVVGYALAGRLVPGIVELSATASAAGGSTSR